MILMPCARGNSKSNVSALPVKSRGKPMQNGFVESFNGRLRDECLNEHLFANLTDAREIIEEWRIDYNTKRPHSSLNGLTPTEFAARPDQGQNWNRLSL